MTKFTVSGPDVDRPAESSSSGLSIAVTYASRASRARQEASYYVRDAAGDVVGRADADGTGSVSVIGEGALAAYRVVQTSPTAQDREGQVEERGQREPAEGETVKLLKSRRRSPGDATEDGDVGDGRTPAAPPKRSVTPRGPAEPGSPRVPSKEDEMPEQKTRARSSRSKKAAASSSQTKTAAKAAAGEKGVDLLATLMAQVETQVAGVKRSPNASETYTRLQTPDGKTFAYIFPPRSTGLAVKIPKQLLAVEADLPRGHGFKKTGWGLTQTIKKASEVPTVAKSFAVAAARVAAPATAAEEPAQA